MSDSTTTTHVSARYTVIIQWSDEDQCYVVSLPEWGSYAKTHGSSYEEAARNAQEVLELLMETEAGRPASMPPEPRLFHYPGADVADLSDNAVQSPAAKAMATAAKKTA
jgi:predicted RNase H-like HicB family nuclease